MEENYGAEVELVPGVAGIFDITVDGVLKYSKKQTGRFPTDDEVVATGNPPVIDTAATEALRARRG